jgi:RNA polymerase sigma-70 factor, ECF subfamily
MQKNPELAVPRDEELVIAAQAGDHAAFAELIERHQATALKMAISILRDRCDAEDELQNGCWKAFEHIGQFQQEARFSTWFNRIVVNQCLMRLRQQRRSRFVYLDDVLVGEEGQMKMELPDRGVTPEYQLGQQELGAVLDQEVRRMPPLLRKVFELRDMDELSMQDVADELEISVPAAKSRLLRARQELRKKLDRHCGRLGLATLTS